MRVLYVEDNPANVFLVKRVAKVGKHEIINYIDGGQALKKFDDIKPDLVLMDIQLAGDIGGLDVVRELRGRGINVPIIAVTAYAMVGDKERCIEAGCDDYLAKPLPVPRLVEIFQEYSEKIATKTSQADNNALIAAPAVEEKSKEPVKAEEKSEEPLKAEQQDETIVSASTATETKTEQEDKQATSSDVKSDAKAELADEIKDAQAETSTEPETTAPVISDALPELEEAEEKVVGSLSIEDTLPVPAQTDSDVSKETAD